jgi:hypothetical protein
VAVAVAPVAAAESVPVAVTALLMLLILALTELVRVSSTPLRLLASAPVAVASTALMELAREATSLVRLPTSDDASLAWLEMREARLDGAAERSDVKSLATLAASEDAAPTALDTLSPIELASSEAVWRMPPGDGSVAVALAAGVAVVKSWAW